jgi:hypothetical protein
MMATPAIRLMIAVNTLLGRGALWPNGATTATTVASPVIQVKKAIGRGAPSNSMCSRPVAASAAAAAKIA